MTAHRSLVTLPPLVQHSSPNQSARREPVRLIVVHRPVGSYVGAIEHLCDPATDASCHVIVREDGEEATQLVPWDRKAWACVAFNSTSDNIETPDNIWTQPLTPDLRVVMHTCARIVAFRCHKRGLPARWRTGQDLLNLRGITRHYDLGMAGGGHTDPTTDVARWEEFVLMVEQELARGGFRKTWGV